MVAVWEAKAVAVWEAVAAIQVAEVKRVEVKSTTAQSHHLPKFMKTHNSVSNVTRVNVKSKNARAVVAKILRRSKCHLWNFRKLMRIGIRKRNLLKIRMLLLILEAHQLKIQFHRLHKINLLKVRFLY